MVRLTKREEGSRFWGDGFAEVSLYHILTEDQSGFFLRFLWLKLIILLQNICCLLMHYLHATATVLRIFGLSEPVKGHGQVQLHLTRRAGVSLSSLDACMATFP